MEQQDFSSFLKDRIRDRGLSLKRLSEASGVPINSLESLIYGNEEKFPPAPYLRGYLIKLGDVLDFDPEPWWKEFKEKQTLKASGPQDRLPYNRFAIKTTHKYLWLTITALIVLGYLGFRFYPIFGKPQLTVIYPKEPLISVKDDTITLTGVANGDKVTVNREEIAVGDDGMWQKRVQLQPGLNTIEITAKKFLGKETKIIRQVIYETPPPTAATSTLQ